MKLRHPLKMYYPRISRKFCIRKTHITWFASYWVKSLKKILKRTIAVHDLQNFLKRNDELGFYIYSQEYEFEGENFSASDFFRLLK